LAPTLKSLKSQRATVFVAIDKNDPDGEKVKVVYRAGEISDELFVRLSDENESESDENGSELVRLLVPIIERWDLKADESDEDPIPITVRGLRPVPTAFLRRILTAVIEDTQPDPTTKKSSSTDG